MSLSSNAHAPRSRFIGLLIGLLRLSRWKEHIPFSVPLTAVGISMAAQHRSVSARLDERVIFVFVANILAVTFAFMVNDLEDAPDDAFDVARAARNPVTCGEIARRVGGLAAFVIGGAALGFYAQTGWAALGCGTLTLALGGLYSWRRIRLKAIPVVDVVSHALMLSTLLFLAGYLTYDSTPGAVWLVAMGLGLVSAYGQLYNQLRDFAADRAAGLRNSAYILGRVYTRWTMYACLGAAGVCIGATIALGLWPLWLAPVLVVSTVVSMLLALRLLPGSVDMRGSEAVDFSGRVQPGLMAAANVVTLVWLAERLIH